MNGGGGGLKRSFVHPFPAAPFIQLLSNRQGTKTDNKRSDGNICELGCWHLQYYDEDHRVKQVLLTIITCFILTTPQPSTKMGFPQQLKPLLVQILFCLAPIGSSVHFDERTNSIFPTTSSDSSNHRTDLAAAAEHGSGGGGKGAIKVFYQNGAVSEWGYFLRS